MNKIFLRDAGIINEKTNKKYFNKKEFFLRLENALLAEIGDSAYQQYLDARKKGVNYDEMRKELGLDS